MTSFTDESQSFCNLAIFNHPTSPAVWASVDPDTQAIKLVLVTGSANPAPYAGNSPTTDQGIGIGSSLAELLQAYPALSPSGEYNGVTYYSIPGDHSAWIAFTIMDGLVETISVLGSPIPPPELCG